MDLCSCEQILEKKQETKYAYFIHLMKEDVMKRKSFRQKLFTQIGPARLILLTFVLVIFIGTVLLMMPFSNAENSASLIDHLFVATTSTCVTGLVPFTVSEQYSLFGKIVVLCLIQIGGLGLMSIMALLLTITRHKLSFKEKGVLMDAINRSSHRDLISFLKSIFLYTLVFEGTGTFLFAFRFVPQFGLAEGLFQSLFLSVSAFCNAGIDLLGSSSLIAYADDMLINFTVIFLIITGGLGFAVWFDLRNQSNGLWKKKYSFRQFWRTLSVHTRIVLISTFVLLSSVTLVFFVLEYSNPMTIGTMSFPKQLLVSLFQSTTLRTAGFATIDIGACTRACQFIMLFVMLIGGSPGGTAGGLKTTTAVLLLLMIKKYMRNEKQAVVMKRSISDSAFEKASLIIMTYTVILIIGIVLLLIVEESDFLSLSFEAFSALATVGLTCGITSSLSELGKLVIIVLMLIGRVGPSTVLLSVLDRNDRTSSEVQYPKAEILIG